MKTIMRFLALLFVGRRGRCYYCGRPSRGVCESCAAEEQAFSF